MGHIRIASTLVLTAVAALFRSRTDLIFESLALRQQLAVLQNRRPRRRMSAGGRLFWIGLQRLWPQWRQVLVVVRPSTQSLTEPRGRSPSALGRGPNRRRPGDARRRPGERGAATYVMS